MKKMLVVIATVSLLAVVLTGCFRSSTGTKVNKAAANEQSYEVNQFGVLSKAEPLPQTKDSGARRVQNNFYTAEADPNKIWYLTLLALDGTPVATYTIRGPVESASDQLTNPVQIRCLHNNGCHPIALGEPNGVYQGPSNDHLATLTDGALLRFDNNYVVADQPNRITSQPKFSINETAPITPTDLSKSKGGTLAPRK